MSELINALSVRELRIGHTWEVRWQDILLSNFGEKITVTFINK